MIVYLAGVPGYLDELSKDIDYNYNRLNSFYHVAKWEVNVISRFKNYLLDSGAFTFMTSKKDENINWENYVIKYANFVKKHNIKYFFELDIDSIVGLKEVERLRAILEKITERQCIPVWHKNRGLDYWKQMCKDYNYISIGGIVTQEIKRTEYDVFTPLLKIARQNNTKVHGLGFTNLKGMNKYRFYSVDSTSWIYGNMSGTIFIFNGKTFDKIKKSNSRLKTRMALEHNFKEWVKFSKYAEQNL